MIKIRKTKKCFHCGKKGKNLVFVDEEEGKKIYLCRKCKSEENKKLKEKMEHTKKIFGYPSYNRVMRMLKSWTGKFEDITTDKIIHNIRWLNMILPIPVCVLFIYMAFVKEVYLLFYLALAALTLCVATLVITLKRKFPKRTERIFWTVVIFTMIAVGTILLMMFRLQKGWKFC